METIREVNRLKNEAARMEANIVQLEGAEGALRAAFEAFMDERMFEAARRYSSGRRRLRAPR